MAHLLNSAVNIVIVNNTRKQPDGWAQEAADSLIRAFVANPNQPPEIQVIFAEYRAKMHEYFYKSLTPIFERCITAEQDRLGIKEE